MHKKSEDFRQASSTAFEWILEWMWVFYYKAWCGISQPFQYVSPLKARGLKASKCCFSFFSILIKSSRWFLNSLKRVQVFCRPPACWDCIFHEPTTLPTSFKEALSSKKILLCLCDGILMSRGTSSQICILSISFENSGGKWQLNMRDAMMAVLTEKNYCSQWWETSEKLIQSPEVPKVTSFFWLTFISQNNIGTISCSHPSILLKTISLWELVAAVMLLSTSDLCNKR